MNLDPVFEAKRKMERAAIVASEEDRAERIAMTYELLVSLGREEEANALFDLRAPQT